MLTPNQKKTILKHYCSKCKNADTCKHKILIEKDAHTEAIKVFETGYVCCIKFVRLKNKPVSYVKMNF